MHKHIKRGDIYLVDLNPFVGSEQGGIRPVLVIQNDIGNLYSPTVIVASITSNYQKKHNLPTHIMINKRGKLRNDSIVLLEQIRTIDKTRLIEYIGAISFIEMDRVNKGLEISISLVKY